MKILYTNMLLLAVIAGLSSCSKSSADLSPVSTNNAITAPKAPPVPVTPPPVARFTVSNIGTNGILEYVPLVISNQSENGASYFWDFGDGNTSTDKDPSFNYAMHGQYAITLRVSNSKGAISEYAIQPFTVICARTNHH